MFFWAFKGTTFWGLGFRGGRSAPESGGTLAQRAKPEANPIPCCTDMSYSLNSLNWGYKGNYVGFRV